MSAEFELAWMLAFNEGLFDGMSPAKIDDRLRRLAERVAQSPLQLDDSREHWQQAIQQWMHEDQTA